MQKFRENASRYSKSYCQDRSSKKLYFSIIYLVNDFHFRIQPLSGDIHNIEHCVLDGFYVLRIMCENVADV